MVYDLAGDLFSHLERLSLRFHGRHGVGDSIRRVTSDSECVSKIVMSALLPVVSSSACLLAMFAVMWRLDRQLTLLALVVVPCMVVVFRRYAGPMLERGYEQEQIEGRLYDVTEQTLSSIKAVQAFGREEHADRRFRSIAEEIVRATLATTGVQFRFGIGMGLTTAAGTAAVLWVGATHVLDGRLTAGSILVFLSYLAFVVRPAGSAHVHDRHDPGSLRQRAPGARGARNRVRGGRLAGAPPLPACAGMFVSSTSNSATSPAARCSMTCASRRARAR